MTVPESKGAAHTSEPFAITLEVGSSLANETGSWRTERPVYVHNLPPCNKACPAGENIQEWLYHAEEEITKLLGGRLWLIIPCQQRWDACATTHVKQHATAARLMKP